MNKQQNKGITLIALVITIVVLVILVGVSVSVTINAGLIANSKKAVADYDVAQQDEKAEIQKVEDIMNSMNPDSLAAKVKVGDYVKYTPKSGEEYTTYTSYKGNYDGDVTTINENGEPTATGTQGNGYGEQTFTVPTDTSGILWRVLSIEDGKVNLVSEKQIGRNGVWTGEDSDQFYLSGLTGYAYGVEELNAVCSIYGTGKGAEGAKSITKEYCDTSSSAFDGISCYGTLCWVANRLIEDGSPDYVMYSVVSVADWSYSSETLFELSPSDGKSYDMGQGNCILPVVTLKSNVKAGTSTTVDGVTTWEIVVPTES